MTSAGSWLPKRPGSAANKAPPFRSGTCWCSPVRDGTVWTSLSTISISYRSPKPPNLNLCPRFRGGPSCRFRTSPLDKGDYRGFFYGCLESPIQQRLPPEVRSLEKGGRFIQQLLKLRSQFLHSFARIRGRWS